MKRLLILLFGLICIGSGFFIFTKNVENSYAVLVDGHFSNDFPSKGNYAVDVDCINANGVWNYDKWQLDVKEIVGDIACDISFSTVSNPSTISDHVKSLEGESTGNGMLIDEKIDVSTFEEILINNSDFYTNVVNEGVESTGFNELAIMEQSFYTSIINDETSPFTWDEINKTWTSSNHDHNTTSSFTFSPSVAGTIAIKFTVSSESCCDKGSVYLNDVLKQGSITGSGRLTLEDLETSDVIKVEYKKDSSASSGTDNIVFSIVEGVVETSFRKFVWKDSNKTWSSTHFENEKEAFLKFSPSVNGDIKINYTESSDSTSDDGFIYLNNDEVKGSINKSGELILPNLTTSDVVEVKYVIGTASDNNEPFSFSVVSGNYITNEVSTGYRYEGKNPNNYVWFNEQLWRIIGVFDTELSTGETVELTKIVKDEPIGAYAWDGTQENNWTSSDAIELLNDNFYNATDGTSGGHCFRYGSINGNCDFTIIGLNIDSRSMVENVVWNLGGTSAYDTNTAEMFYSSERGTTVYNGRPTTWTGKIALMYPSDYGYSVLETSCARTTKLSYYDSSSCAGKSWLYGDGSFYTINQLSSTNLVVTVVNLDGSATISNGDDGYSQSPVLYLKSSVKILTGDGSIEKPYILIS